MNHYNYNILLKDERLRMPYLHCLKDVAMQIHLKIQITNANTFLRASDFVFQQSQSHSEFC